MIRFCLLLFTALCLFSIDALGCWAAPPPVAWGHSADKKFEFKKDNEASQVTVYEMGKRDAALWTVKIDGYSSLFSSIYLVEDGTKIVHVRNNHMVSKLEDTAVSIYTKDSVKHLPAKTFVSEIGKPTPGEPMMSTDPGRYWLKQVKSVTDTKLTLVTHDGKSHDVTI